MGRCCQCTYETYPDCFGCPVIAISIPTAWQLDFPLAMTYQSGPATRTCTATSTQVGGLGITPASPPYETVRTTVDTATVEFPDLSSLGVPSVMDLDENALLNPSLPYTQCIWASNEFLYYEHGQQAGANGIGIFGCPQGGYPPASFLGAEYTGVDAWQYRPTGTIVPASYSGNRVRETIVATDYRCGTLDLSTCNPWTLWSCNFLPFGVFSILQVTELPSAFEFNLRVFWWPRVNRRVIATEYTRNTIDGSVSDTRYVTPPSLDRYVNILDFSNDCMALFPEATAKANLSQGILLRYTKTVNCAADFLGTPVVLTKVNEYSASAGATHTQCEALGINNVPATVTITPI